MKISFLFILPILLNCASINLFAQKSVITGRIFSQNNIPAYVTVQLKRQKKITETDNDGYFKLANVEPIEDTLVITSAESQTKLIGVNPLPGETRDLGNIALSFNVTQLQDIEVKGRTTHSYKSDYSFLGTKTESASIDIPQSISSITKELIQDRMDFTLKDVANEAAGVNNYSGYDDYSIRGFKAENARLINGLRGYNTTYTSAMLVNVERVEVVKGPSATLYGNCDPGGTINLVTKKPLPTQQTEINIGGGTWDHYRVSGDVTGPLNSNKTFLYRLNAGYDKTNSFRNQYFAKSYEAAPSLSFVPNDKIQLNVDFSLSNINTKLDRGQPGFQNSYSLQSTPVSLIASQPGDYLHETDYATNVLFSYKLNEHINFNSGYLNYITQQNVAEHGVQSYTTADSVNLYFSKWDYHTVTNTISNYFTFRFNTGKFTHQLLAGYDYIRSKVELDQEYYEDRNLFSEGSGIAATFSLKNPTYIARPVNKYSVSDYESDATDVDATVYHTHGIYLQEQISVHKWKLLLGLREEMYRAGDDEADSTENDDDEENVFLPRVGLVYELKPNASLYASYNKGFDPFEASTSTQLFDAPFKPITSESFEAGAKANFFHNKASASIALYQLTLHNVAVNANNIANPDLYIQQGEDRSRGIETEINGNILTNLSVATSYSYCVAKVIKSKIASQEGMLVENAPKNESSSWIKYTFISGSLKNFSIAAGHSQVSRRNTLEQGLTLPGYIILNAGLRYAYKKFDIALNLNNIMNKTYWIGAYNNVNKWPGASRNFMMTAGYKF